MLTDPYIGDIARRQIGGATALALTKTDLRNDEEARTVRSHVLELARPRIVSEANQGKVPDGLFFSDDALPR